jgi:hypothetical protein
MIARYIVAHLKSLIMGSIGLLRVLAVEAVIVPVAVGEVDFYRESPLETEARSLPKSYS